MQSALKKQLRFIETQRAREREYMLDFYEGINMDRYVEKYFGAETLRQVPMLHQNLTKRVTALRGMTFKKAPKVDVNEQYFDFVDKNSLQAQRRLCERLTFLLGTMAFRSIWNEQTQKVEHECLPFFEPLFLAGDRRDKPVGVTFPIEYQGNAKLERPMHAVWTEDRPGVPGQHYLIDQDGRKQSVNEFDRNPYGILPVTFSHRYPPIRDFWAGSGAMDVVAVDLATNVAQMELSLAIRFGCLGIKHISGVDDSSRISIGTDKILYMPEGAEFGVSSPSGSLSEIIESTRFLIESTLNNNHIRAKYARNDSGNAPSAASLSIIEMENMDERSAQTEDTWRPWEHRRYDIDRQIIKTETNTDLGPDYSVDFLEPNYALTPESEIALWSWRFDRGLATPEDWFEYHNSDASPAAKERFLEAQNQRQEEDQPPANRLLNRLQS
nr:hypothetical protein [uncultured Mediterranean phage uvMED]